MAFHIVVIDDDAALQGFYSLLLESAGYTVTIFSPFDLLASSVTALHPDLIILDVMMNRKQSIWTLLQALTSTPQVATTPILITTAFSVIIAEAKWKEVLQEHTIPVIMKPFDIDALLATIHALLPDVSSPTSTSLYNDPTD